MNIYKSELRPLISFSCLEKIEKLIPNKLPGEGKKEKDYGWISFVFTKALWEKTEKKNFLKFLGNKFKILTFGVRKKIWINSLTAVNNANTKDICHYTIKNCKIMEKKDIIYN